MSRSNFAAFQRMQRERTPRSVGRQAGTQAIGAGS